MLAAWLLVGMLGTIGIFVLLFGSVGWGITLILMGLFIGMATVALTQILTRSSLS